MLNPKTIKAIDDLRRHINSGCLSGILPGEGTEKNERFHRHLRRSLLVGANTMSPELAVACLTGSIYVWNCRKKKQRHFKNQRFFPIVPPECFIGSSQASHTFVAFRDTGSHTMFHPISRLICRSLHGKFPRDEHVLIRLAYCSISRKRKSPKVIPWSADWLFRQSNVSFNCSVLLIMWEKTSSVFKSSVDLAFVIFISTII